MAAARPSISTNFFSSNSADYQSIIQSTTPSKDEDDDEDDQHHFLTPSLDTDLLKQTDVVDQQSTLEISHNDTDSIHLPAFQTYHSLSTSSSESSLARPLLPEKHRTAPTYTSNINADDVLLKTSSTPSDSLVFNQRTWMKFYLTDMFLSAFIITPLVNLHWRGAWDIIDLYLLPNYERTSAFVSLSIGLSLLYVIYLTQNSLQTFYETHRTHFLGQTMSRLYTLIFALAYINQWRGLWNLFDLTSNVWYILLLETVISVVCLLAFKSICDLNSAPFLIGTDTEPYFLIDSKYKISVSVFIDWLA